jgi:death on curing protein
VTNEPEWLLEAAVRAIHQMLIAEHGGVEGIRDAGLLASALARPQNLLAYTDPPPGLFALAASYAYGLARNHCFVDGNKRIALAATLTFLSIHGYRLAAPKIETYSMTVGLADGTVSEAAFASWLEAHCQPTLVERIDNRE